jgi:oxygen-dependent protoporphyrinogen oxidase
MKQVAIIGGGITGLTAARVLKQYGTISGDPIQYTVIERAGQPGGKVRTENIDGFVVEAGPDCFVADKPWIRRLASELEIEDRLLAPNESSRRSYIFSEARVHELPEGLLLLLPTKITPFLMSPLISWQGKARMACDAFIPRKKDHSDETLASFVRRRLGKEILDKIAAPLVGGIHSNNPETMSLRASFPRFLNMEEEHGSLIRSMLTARVKAAFAKPKEGAGYFLSFKQGMGEISASLAASLEKQRILCSRMVGRIEKMPHGTRTPFRVHFSDGHEPLEADAVVLATAANQAARMLERLDPVVAGLLREIPHTSSANISLAFKTDELAGIPEGFGLMIPAIEKRNISAITLSSTKWTGRVPDPKYSLLRVFVGGYRNQDLASLDDKDLLRIVRSELSDLFGISALPAMTRIHRWIEERPQYTLGHIERVAAVERGLARHGSLFVAGCSYNGIGVGDCVASGFAAANAVIEMFRVTRTDSSPETTTRKGGPCID